MISDGDTDEILITEQLPYLIHYNFHFDKTFQNVCCLSKQKKKDLVGSKLWRKYASDPSYSIAGCSTLFLLLLFNACTQS